MFCKNCGTSLNEDAKFCTSCGHTVDTAEAENNQITEPIPNVGNVHDHTSEYDSTDISANKVVSAIGYLGILVLIPILTAKDSKFAKFHANQSLGLFIANIGLTVVRLIMNAFITSLSLYAAVSFVFGIASVILGIIGIVGIVYAAQGKAKELPFVNKVKILK